MNKKLIGAILCIGLLALCAFPAIDASAEESPLTVTIKSGFQKGVTVYINNTGATDLTNVHYEINVTRNGILNRGIFKRNIVVENGTGDIASIAANTEVNVTANTFAFLWTFFVWVTVKVTADGLTEPIEQAKKGVALFGFTRIRWIELI